MKMILHSGFDSCGSVPAKKRVLIRCARVILVLTLALHFSGCALPRIQLYSGDKRPDEQICLVRNHPWFTSLSLTSKDGSVCLFSTNKALGKVLFEVDPGAYKVCAKTSFKGLNSCGYSGSGTLGAINSAAATMNNIHAANYNEQHKDDVLCGKFVASPNRVIMLIPEGDHILTGDMPNNAFTRSP